MSAPVGHWRATYTPGEWVVLAGPTSVVVLEPASGAWSALIGAIWSEVINSSSITELAGALSAYQLDTMPSFGAFFWTEDGMRSLVRGAVEVVDDATGDLVASGAEVLTWNEVGLADIRRVRIDLPGVESGSADPDRGQPAARAEYDADERDQEGNEAAEELLLPLVVGTALAASVILDCSEAAQVTSVQGPDDQAGSDDQDESDNQVESDDQDDEQAGDGQRVAGSEDRGRWAAEPDPTGLDAGPATEVYPAPTAGPDQDEEPGSGQPDGATRRTYLENADTQFMAIPPALGGTGGAAAGGGAVGGGLLSAAAVEEMENGSTQMMPVATGAAEPLQDVSDQSMIMAVVCPNGHTSPQNATTCRLCHAPIGPQSPQLVPRPPLAVLRASDGSTADVDRAVLIGRAPAADRSMARAPRLLTVPSPGHDISRTHVEVAPDGWQVTVTDLQSTNGTLVIGPGEGRREQLAAGQPTVVQLGTVLELGDGIVVLVDAPGSSAVDG